PGGHIIITSRLQNWPAYVQVNKIGVSLFSPLESMKFLRARVPALAVPEAPDEAEERQRGEEAARLARALGGLPIATELAAAYLAETKQNVSHYVDQLDDRVHRLPVEPFDYPAPILAAWEISTALLSPDA